MSQNKSQISRLKTLTDLILDLRLGELERAARLRNESLERLCDLNKPTEVDTSSIAEITAHMLYERWADHRRAELNITLARQTAEWLTRQDAARRALGQSQVLGKLSK